MKTIFATDLDSNITAKIECEESDCAYCTAAAKYVTFTSTEESIFIMINGHVHQVHCISMTNDGAILSCGCVEKEWALNEIERNRKSLN